MIKKNVCVIFGGQSSEHEVSLASSSFVMKNVDPARYNLIPVGITKEGRWLLYEGPLDKVADGSWQSSGLCTPAVITPDATVSGLTVFRGQAPETIKIDCALPVLHGKYGEDGTIQGLFVLAGIPFVGCGVFSSSAAMDKVYSRTIFDFSSLPQARWFWFYDFEYKKDKDAVIRRVESEFAYPVFVKPANSGSSVGISKAKNHEELVASINLAFEHDDKVLIEEFIQGREIEVSVLGSYDPFVSVCGEVLPAREFYDYIAKYQDENSRLVIPARLTESEYASIKNIAVKAFNLIGCKGLSRVDFFIRESDGKVILNELNTMPGFTSISMYPKMLEASGIHSTELITRLIELGMEK